MGEEFFISYSSEDLRECKEFRKLLTAWGYSYWVDRESIPGSAQWSIEISKGIAASTALVLLISDSSLASAFVLSEVTIAFNHRKPILPVRLTDDPLTEGFELFLAGTHFVRIEHEDDIRKALETISAHHTESQGLRRGHHLKRRLKKYQPALLSLAVVVLFAVNFFHPSVSPLPTATVVSVKPWITVKPFALKDVDTTDAATVANTLTAHLSNDRNVQVRPYVETELGRAMSVVNFGRKDSAQYVIFGSMQLRRRDSSSYYWLSLTVQNIDNNQQICAYTVDQLPSVTSDTLWRQLATFGGKIVGEILGRR